MEGVVFDIRHFSIHDGPGIRSTVFFKGCPLRCAWCHNPESHLIEREEYHKTVKMGQKEFQVQEVVGRHMAVAEVMAEVRADIPIYDESKGGVTISGGEPLMQPKFLRGILEQCKLEDIHTALDTCGFASAEVFESVFPFTDLFLYDLKLADSNLHRKYTGVPNEIILQNLHTLDRLNKTTYIRIPLIDGITDTSSNLSALRTIIASHRCVKRVDVLPFHNIARSKYDRFGKEYTLAHANAYSTERALEIKAYFEEVCEVVSIGG